MKIMTNLEKITITHEFQQVCDIFKLSPEQVVQDFIDNVSIADYLCDPYSLNRWANTFVFEYVIAQVESEEIMVKYGKFAEKLVNAALANPKDAKDLAQKMVDEWHQAVLEDRIKEVMEEKDQSNDK
ncbi:hypothetical protein SAMN05421747_11557 [Parapedobacter composti]|jgi:hypothetical protein|nr:hypothetical protein [Parapedobacter composti]SFC58078.1 hypothetical protein SAMN05421747_11557 [Parapedobacter composti]